MIRSINITDCEEDLNRFADEADMRDFLHKYRCDGFEYMPAMGGEDAGISKTLISGVHMRSFNCWVDLWRGNKEALLEEFGSMEVVEQVYGGLDRQALIDYFRRDLEIAKKVEAKYVVFHASEVKIKESCTYRFTYTDQEVAISLCELVNELLDGQEYHFYFLLENLWWPGWTGLDPEITRFLMENIHYKKNGFMLDTGHLLHTNLELKSQEEGLAYINQVLDGNPEMIPYIKGMHVQQSITGERVKEMLKTDMQWADAYYDRWCQIFSYIFQIDLHKPFTASGVRALIDRINPRFLTMELISRDRQQHEELLKEQMCIFLDN